MSDVSATGTRPDPVGDGVRDVASAPAALGRAPREVRPDIQALRAIAVMAVVIYHLWPERLPGGFVGVDIFFVISGFLITRHLVDEVDRTGRIGLTQFWARRIRRLLPAAFTVLVVSLLTLLLVMPRVTWLRNLQEIGASAAYVENWLLGIHAIDYLASEDSASLVQHYWSLAAEEQFYLVWPLLLLLAVGLTRLVRRLSVGRAVLGVLTLAGGASFGVSIVLTATSPALAFFATPARAWEFAAGGVLAVAPALRLGAREQAVRAAASWLGLAVIGYSVFLVTGSRPFPGWIAAVPVLGAVLLLAGGSSTARWSPAPLMRVPTVQWLGNYSYSLYLWHWPPIVAAPWVLHGPTTWVSKLVILAGALVLAYLTKRFVEDPVRTGRRWRVRRWPSYAFAVTGAVVLVAVTSTSSGSLEQRNAELGQTALADAVDQVPCFGASALVEGCSDPFGRPAGLDTAFAATDFDVRGDECQANVDVPTLTLCEYGDTTDPERTVMVVGNSHAVRLVPALDLYGKENGWKILLAAKTDCLGVSTSPVGEQSADDPCVLWSADVLRTALATTDLDAVVFASHRQAQDFVAGVDATTQEVDAARGNVMATWTSLRDAGVPVVVVEDVPAMAPDNAPECIAQSTKAIDPCPTDRSERVRPNLETELALAHPELVSYLPMTKYFCDDSLCHALIGGVVVYSDSHHLTTTYSLSLARYLGPDLEAMLTR